MSDTAKILKLLNLTSSANDAEALAALRMAQKYLDRNLGDFLSLGDNGHAEALKEKDDAYTELEALFESEVEKSRKLKDRLDDQEKSLRKRERDNMNLKRDLKAAEKTIDEYREAESKAAAKASSPSTLEDLEFMLEAEQEKSAKLKDWLDDRDKMIKKNQRDIMGHKRETKAYERKIEGLEADLEKVSQELMAMKSQSRR